MAQSGQIKKIGLLGGSFNPAHSGHVYISRQAHKLLGLDEIWWLVSKQNPLKSKQGMGSFETRIEQATKTAAGFTKIKVSDFEKNVSTNYTYDILHAIKDKYPQNNFIWLMGADNLLQFPKWYKWKEIINLLPIAVFNRRGFKQKALSGEVAVKFAENKIADYKKLALSIPPAWVFLDIKTNPESATRIRRSAPTSQASH